MEKLFNFNRFKFIKENLIKEDSEFNQYSFGGQGVSPLGPGYGFASDPRMSIFGMQDSPYNDFYSRKTGMINDLMNVIKKTYKVAPNDYKFDYFVEDLDDYENIKILRMNENQQMKLDVFISFDFKEKEYFGVFKNFNTEFNKPSFVSELYESNEHAQIDYGYRLKLETYLFKILNNWFIPKKGFYKNLKENNIIRNEFGGNEKLKKDYIVEVLGYKKIDNNLSIDILYKKEKYTITGNDFYWFNWRYDKLK